MIIRFLSVLILLMCALYANEQLIVKAIGQDIGNILITPDNSKIILETRTLKENETNIRVYEASTLHQLFVFDKLKSYIKSMTTTNNILTLTSHNDIRQYDLCNGNLINKIDVNYGPILVSPDGSIAVSIESFRSTDTGKVVRSQASIWGITHKKQIDNINFQESNNIFPVGFSKDSQLIIIEGRSQQDGFLTIYDLKNQREIFRYNHLVAKQILISPDNKTLFLKTFNPSLLKAFSLTDGKELLSVPEKDDVKFFPTQNRFLLLGRKMMHLFDYPTMKELGTFDHQCFNTYYGKIDILSDDGNFLCEGKDAVELRSLYDPELAQKVLAYENPNLFNFSVSNDKTVLLTVDGRGGDNGIDIYKLKPELSKIGSIDKLSGVNAIASNANHTKLYVAGRYSLWVYDLDDPSKNRYIKTQVFRPISIVTGEEKNILYIADGGYNSSVYKFDMNTAQFLGSFGLSRFTDTDVGTSIFISPDKKKIYVRLRADNKTCEFDIHTFKKLNEYEENEINMDGLTRLLQDEIGVEAQLNPEGGIIVTRNGAKTSFYGFNSGEWITVLNDTKYLVSDKSMAQYIYRKDGSPIDSSQGGNSYE